MEHSARLYVAKEVRLSKVDERLFSSFIEHLGRAVYGGIYEKSSKEADEEGFRRDVLALVRELKVPMVRYPGGNFVSGYRWEDGVGEKRVPRVDLAWRTIEPNTIGLNEFSSWAKKANTDVMMAVNLGTRSLSDALNLLEYCNIDGGTYYSDLRRSHGYKEPHKIKTWCLGNEMDGPWQTGHKEAHEYGALAASVAAAMKMLDHDIELVACGSSNSHMPTFPEWEREVLTSCYDYVDYISMHQYFALEGDDTPSFLASSVEMDRFISTVVSTCDYVKAAKRSGKTMMISFDEWNVWYHNKRRDDELMEKSAWTVAPPLLEDIYTHEDALLVGSMLITLLKHADRVKVACLAQLVNVIAPIMVTNDKAWRQTIYYPYKDVSLLSRGAEVLYPAIKSSCYSTPSYQDVLEVDAVALYNEAEGKVIVFAVNKNLTGNTDFEIDLSAFSSVERVKAREMKGPLKAVNGPDAEVIHPVERTDIEKRGKTLSVSLSSASWNTFEINVR